jgi:hypothetical protein
MDIKRKRGLKGLMAVALAAVTALTIGTIAPSTAKAIDASDPTKVAISKTFNSDPVVEGSFVFSFAPVQVNEDAKTDTNMPATFTNTIAFDGTGSTTQLINQVVTWPTVSSTGTAGTDFTHAGEYIYTVTETNASTMTGTGTKNFSGASYKVHIYITNESLAAGKIASVQVDQLKDDTGTDVDGTPKVNPVPADTTTAGGFAFTNSYVENTSLVISKTVPTTQTTPSGSGYGDQTRLFTFTPSVTLPASVVEKDMPATILGTIYNGTTASSDTVTLKRVTGTHQYTIGGTTTPGTFTMHSGQSLQFLNVMPVGSTYTLSEDAAAGYTASLTATKNTAGDTNSVANTQANTAIASGTQTVYKQATAGTYSTCAVTNTYKDVSPTGIIIQNLPFIIMGIVAVGGIALLALSRRRKNNA